MNRLAPNAAPMSPKFFARDFSSLRSAMADWVTAMLPEKQPMTMRLKNARGRLASMMLTAMMTDPASMPAREKMQYLFPAIAVGKRAEHRGGKELAEREYPEDKSQYRGPDRYAGAGGDYAAALVQTQRRENGDGDGQPDKIQESRKGNDGEVPPEMFLFHKK